MLDDKATTTITLPFKNVTLDSHSLIDLCKIIAKAADYGPLARQLYTIEGESQQLKAHSLESLDTSRLPTDLHAMWLWAYSAGRNYEIDLRATDVDFGFMSLSQVDITSPDSDWVAARKQELQNFLSDHKNYHWIFQNWFSIIPQVIVLSTLIGYLIRDNPLSILIAMLSGYAYFYVTRRTFPVIVLDTGRPSGLKTFRKLLTVVIPILALGLLVNFIWTLISSA